LTNKHEPEKTSVKVTKAWNDANNQDGVRPDSVKVKLLADGVEVPGKTLTLTADHRVVDGLEGAKFMKTLKEAIENPLSLLI